MLKSNEMDFIYSNVKKFSFNEEYLDDNDKIWTQFALSKDCQTSTVKEKATLLKLGYNTSTHMHGFDGMTPDGRQVEVKSETANPDQGKYGKKLNGGAGWGTKNMDTYNKLTEENPLLVHSGFTEDGKCVYVAECEFNDTKIFEQIEKYAKARKGGANSTTKSDSNHWKDAVSLKVHYFAPKYQDRMTKPFAELISAKWRETKKVELLAKDKEDLVELILNGG